MKKLKNKIIVAIGLAILLMTSMQNCFAFEIGVKDLISLKECEKLLTYDGRPVTTHYVVYDKDGVQYPAYCLNVDADGVEKGSYPVNGMGILQDMDANLEGAWKAIINGYPYQSLEALTKAIEGKAIGNVTEEEAYTATKHAVYTMLDGRASTRYASIGSEAGNRTYQLYLHIVAAANNTGNMQRDLQVQIEPQTDKWQVDNHNATCVSKTYVVNANFSSGNCEIYTRGLVPNGTIVTDTNNQIKNTFQIGEQFKILMPIQNLTQSESFTIEAKANLETKPVIYGGTTVPGKQNYALTGYMYEVVDRSLTEDYFKNITKIRVIKKEYGTETRLAGVKFHLLDANQNIIMQDLVTNENGEIILENMLPGTYYLQEIETLENYNLYTDLIEIPLDLNEEFEVTVNNTTRTVTKVDKDFEIVEVTPIYEETVYDVHKEATIKNEQIVKKLPVTGY